MKTTVSQQGKLERRVQQQAGHKAQQCEHQWRRWHCSSTIAWRITTCIEPARIVSQSLMTTLTLMAQVLSAFHLIFISSMCAVVVSLWLDFLRSLLLHLPPVRFPFPLLRLLPRAVAWAPLHEGHGKPAPLRGEREWGHLRRLQLSHRLWAQGPWLRRAPELVSPLSFKIPSADQDVDDLTLGEMLTEAYRGQVDYFVQGGVSVSQSSSSVRFDGSGQLDGEMVDRSGQPDERNSSNAKIRTLLEEQRQTIIAEYLEKVGHHELQAAHAEEERRLLQGQLWRQKLEFREAHQQSLTEMEELRKLQISAFDTIARRKLIEDQNTFLELFGRIQELQSEINCMNDSKDFQDAESVRSGHSHVTSRPVPFPLHPIPEGMLRHSFVSPSRKEGPPSIWDTHMVYRETFL